MLPDDWFKHLDSTQSPLLAATARRLRELALASGPDTTKEVKYGGVLFAGARGFCGIFSYAAHITLEFGEGAALSDPQAALSGKGKGRRHLKFVNEDEANLLQAKHFIQLARAHADRN
jgi:hypothetical protein